MDVKDEILFRYETPTWIHLLDLQQPFQVGDLCSIGPDGFLRHFNVFEKERPEWFKTEGWPTIDLSPTDLRESPLSESIFHTQGCWWGVSAANTEQSPESSQLLKIKVYSIDRHGFVFLSSVPTQVRCSQTALSKLLAWWKDIKSHAIRHFWDSQSLGLEASQPLFLIMSTIMCKSLAVAAFKETGLATIHASGRVNSGSLVLDSESRWTVPGLNTLGLVIHQSEQLKTCMINVIGTAMRPVEMGNEKKFLSAWRQMQPGPVHMWGTTPHYLLSSHKGWLTPPLPVHVSSAVSPPVGFPPHNEVFSDSNRLSLGEGCFILLVHRDTVLLELTVPYLILRFLNDDAVWDSFFEARLLDLPPKHEEPVSQLYSIITSSFVIQRSKAAFEDAVPFLHALANPKARKRELKKKVIPKVTAMSLNLPHPSTWDPRLSPNKFYGVPLQFNLLRDLPEWPRQNSDTSSEDNPSADSASEDSSDEISMATWSLLPNPLTGPPSEQRSRIG